MMVTGTLSGNFSILPDKVLVRDMKGEIIVQQGLGVRVFPERRIVGFRAVLAEWAPDHSGYNIVAKAEMHPLDQTLSIGQSLPVTDVNFDIPTGNLTPDQVKYTWLEFEVQMEIPGGERKGDVGSTYILCDAFLMGDKTYLRMGPPKGVTPPDPALFHTE